MAAAIAVLYFNPFSPFGFEADKAIGLLALTPLLIWQGWRLRTLEQPAPDHGAVFAHTARLCALGAIAILVLTALMSIHPWTAWLGSPQRAFGIMTWLALSALCAVASRVWQPDVVLRGLALICTLASLYPLTQAMGLDPLNWHHSFDGRSFGSLGNPVFLGSVLALGTVLSAHALTHAGSRVMALAWAASLLLQVSALLATRSRAALIGTVCGLATLWLLHLRRRQRLMALALALMAGLTLTLLPGAGTRLRELVDTDGGSVAVRLSLWQQADQARSPASPLRGMHDVSDTHAGLRIWLGWGADAYHPTLLRERDAASQLLDQSMPGAEADRAHAWLLDTALAGGSALVLVLGMALFALLAGLLSLKRAALLWPLALLVLALIPQVPLLLRIALPLIAMAGMLAWILLSRATALEPLRAVLVAALVALFADLQPGFLHIASGILFAILGGLAWSTLRGPIPASDAARVLDRDALTACIALAALPILAAASLGLPAEPRWAAIWAALAMLPLIRTGAVGRLRWGVALTALLAALASFETSRCAQESCVLPPWWSLRAEHAASSDLLTQAAHALPYSAALAQALSAAPELSDAARRRYSADAVRLSPSSWRAWAAHARNQLAVDPGTAVIAAAHALRLARFTPPQRAEAALALAGLLPGLPLDAALATELLDALPQSPSTLRTRAFVQAQSGDTAAAIESYLAHLSLSAGDHPARRNLALLLAREGRSGEALEQARRVQAEDPNDRRARALVEALERAQAVPRKLD